MKELKIALSDVKALLLERNTSGITSNLRQGAADSLVSKLIDIESNLLLTIDKLSKDLPNPKRYFQHSKGGGIYEFLYYASVELNKQDAVVYRCVKTDTVWLRPQKEFEERFIELIPKVENEK